MDIADKIVVVTGAASGIGKALCERFAKEGAKLVVCSDMNEEGAKATAADVGGIAVTTDVSNEDEINGGSDPTDFFSVPDGIAPPAISPAFRIESAQRSLDGSFTVVIPSVAGTAYRLEGSADLQNFDILSERTASGSTLALTAPKREGDFYYRVVRIE